MIANSHAYVLITGAGSSIGRAFARVFAEDGYWLILVDGHQGDLNEIETEIRNNFPMSSVSTIYKDLSSTNAALELYEEINASGKKVSILVNNDSWGEYGLFVDTDLEKELDIIRGNIISATELSKFYLKEMLARNEGKILQVASVASFVPTPYMAVYGASKAYLLFLSEALQHEIKDTDVTITILCPGASDEDFFNKAHDWETVIESDSKGNPAEVARKGYIALMQGKKREIIGTLDELQLAIHNIVPDSWLASALGKLFDQRSQEEGTIKI